MLDLITSMWPESAFIALILLLALCLATSHIMRTKNDVSAAIAWLGLIWLAPIFGLLCYFLFGLSRIRRRAASVRDRRGLPPRAETHRENSASAALLQRKRWISHSRLGEKITGNALLAGNTITALNGGRDAYDAMIDAIEKSEKTIALTTYIFQADQAGRRFVTALGKARDRGVDVRVLVDSVGNLYGLKPVSGLLRRRGIRVATFNPARISWRLAFFNLRTHRKLLMIDGKVGFAGGMNIRKHHLEVDGVQKVRDIHFSIEGPVITQMMDAFADDWLFSTGNDLNQDAWYPPTGFTPGTMLARAVPDGPDEPRDRTALIMESALGAARERVQIITPYFLPTAELISALSRAALRGVQVDILTPEKSNLPLFSLVTMAAMRQMIHADCNIYLSPAPFDHSKLMIIDDAWVLFGSSNWDARSLQLNFEFNMEVYDQGLAQQLTAKNHEKFAAAKKLNLKRLRSRPLWKRALGRFLWLASPYL